MKTQQLVCPHCEHPLVHQSLVDVFFREQDEPSGIHVTVSTHNVVLDTKQAGNPSPRRDGVLIRLWCEGCSANSELTIIQHKGETLLEHRKTSATKL